MSTLSTFNAAVLLRVPESDNVIDSAGRNSAVAEAVATFNRHRPQRLVADIAGSDVYDLSLPADWVEGFSEVLAVEYPAGEREPLFLDPETYLLYDNASTVKLRLLEYTPQAGETVRLTYTIPHVVDADSSTIAAGDEDALSNLAAAAVCEWLSSYYSQTTSSSLLTDAVDHKSQATEYALRAKRFRMLGLEHLGVSEGKGGGGSASVQAAGVQRDYDMPSYQTLVRLTHPQR